MENKFLAIDKRYFGTGLKSLDLLIVAHIEEFQRNDCECYLTNQQFCEMFGEDVNAVKRSIKKLEDMGVITRHTRFVSDNGRSNRQRKLTINHQWKAHNEPSITEWKAHSEPSIGMEGSDDADGRLKSGEWMAHSEPIKDKQKIIKDNVLKAHNEPTISPEEKDGVSGAEDVISPVKKEESVLPGKRMEDLSPIERFAIEDKIKAGVPYGDIEREYGLKQGAIAAKDAGLDGKKELPLSGDGKYGRRIRDLCKQEVKEIREKLKRGVPYLDIEAQYEMRHGQIDKDFEKRYGAYLRALAENRVHD